MTRPRFSDCPRASASAPGGPVDNLRGAAAYEEDRTQGNTILRFAATIRLVPSHYLA